MPIVTCRCRSQIRCKTLQFNSESNPLVASVLTVFQPIGQNEHRSIVADFGRKYRLAERKPVAVE